MYNRLSSMAQEFYHGNILPLIVAGAVGIGGIGGCAVPQKPQVIQQQTTLEEKVEEPQTVPQGVLQGPEAAKYFFGDYGTAHYKIKVGEELSINLSELTGLKNVIYDARSVLFNQDNDNLSFIADSFYVGNHTETVFILENKKIVG